MLINTQFSQTTAQNVQQYYASLYVKHKQKH